TRDYRGGPRPFCDRRGGGESGGGSIRSSGSGSAVRGAVASLQGRSRCRRPRFRLAGGGGGGSRELDPSADLTAAHVAMSRMPDRSTLHRTDDILQGRSDNSPC